MRFQTTLLYILIISVLVLTACTNNTKSLDKMSDSDNIANTSNSNESSQKYFDWKNTELMDVNSGEYFKISDFRLKPILIESFAVWCPTCTKQQNEIKTLHEDIGDDVISVTLDADPNEDENKVLRHTELHGFNWRYSVSPKEMTQGLINDFGLDIVNPSSSPIILICPNGNARLLNRGVKTALELKAAVNTCEV